MNRRFRLGMSAAVILMASVAQASVRTGYDAWQRGDFTAAVGQWRPLAIAGDSDAQFNLGQAYKMGRGVPVALDQAEAWFRKAADQGHVAARDNLGLVMFQAGKQAEAMPYIEDAAGRGDPRAQYVFATALFNGDYVKRDRVRAYALMTRASASGTSAASASLAQMDRALSADERARGLALARAFETKAAATLPDDRHGFTVDSVLATSVPAPTGREAKPKPISAAPRARLAVPRVAAKLPAVAATAALPTGRWKVQVAALSDASRADALWTRLRARQPALSRYRLFVVPAGKFVRVQVGPLAGRGEAEQLCRVLHAADQGCLIVAP